MLDHLRLKGKNIEDIVDTEFGKLLQQVHLGKLNVVDSRIHVHERLDMSEELMSVVSDPVDDT